MDFITNITVDCMGEGEGEIVSRNNYKEVLDTLNRYILSAEHDNELIDEEFDKLAEDWVEGEKGKSWEEWNEKANKLTNEKLGNRDFIKRCENTIEIIEKIAELREWE